MINVRRTLFAAACSVAIGSAVAYAAGNYSTYPIVGAASFCASTNSSGPGVGGTTGQTGTQGVCAQTVPAGPPDLTGSELVPADTGLQLPATVTVPVPSLASGAPNYVSALTLQGASEASTATYTIPNNVTNTILDPTGTLTAATITLPSAPFDGQLVRIASSQLITPTLVITPSSASTSIKNSATAFGAVPYSATFIYNLAKNAWYRL